MVQEVLERGGIDAGNQSQEQVGHRAAAVRRGDGRKGLDALIEAEQFFRQQVARVQAAHAVRDHVYISVGKTLLDLLGQQWRALADVRVDRNFGEQGVRINFRQAAEVFDIEKLLRFKEAACKYKVHTFS